MVGPRTFTLPAHSKYRKANIFISCVVGHDFSGWNRPLGVDAFSRSAAATIHWVQSFGNHRCALLHLVAGPFAEMTPNCYARRDPRGTSAVVAPLRHADRLRACRRAQAILTYAKERAFGYFN